MKKRILLAGLFLPLGMLYAQAPITNSPGTATNGTTSNQFWSRAGNTNAFGSNNVLGTLWDSHLWLQTNGLSRVQIFSNQGTLAPTWVSPLPFGGGMGINLDPSNPIRNPLSLLHIGEPQQTGQQGGYRSWMKVGTFYGQSTDQLYIGLKTETSTVSDRADAIINWGDNTNVIGTPTQYGPDFLRFIFTAPRGDAAYNTYAAGNDGLEVMRFQHDGSVGIGNFYNDVLFPYKTPARRLEILSDKTTATGNGTPVMRMTHTQQNPNFLINTGKYIDFEPRSTGDLAIQSYDNTLTTTADRNFKERYIGINTPNPGNTVEINSQFTSPNTLNGNGNATGWAGLRFSDLNSTSFPQVNPGRGVLTVNTNGDVIYVESPSGASGTTGAHNGTSVSTLDNTKVAFGNDIGGTVAQLLSDREIPMNNHNVVFTNPASPSSVSNRFGIGTSTPTAKLDVQLVAGTTNIPNPTVINIINNRSGSNGNAFGQTVKVTGTNNQNYGIQLDITAGTGNSRGINSLINGNSPSSNNNIGVYGGAFVSGSPIGNIGVAGDAAYARYNMGAVFHGTGIANAVKNYGVDVYVQGAGTATNSGIRIQASGIGSSNYGIESRVISTSGTNVGVWSFIANPNLGANRAGKFLGKLEATAPLIVVSDQQFKTNVSGLSGSLKLLSALKPVSYNMDIANYSDFGFDDKLQYGFIAQDVANVFPNLVYDGTFEAEYDSLGNVTDTAVNYKSLNYLGFIPVNTAAIIELNKKVDAISLSDQTIKTNVQDLTGSLAKVLDMRGVSYDWDHTIHPELNLDSLNQVGFIAQEIQLVDPRLTFLADDSLLHVKYEKVVPILAEAIQELNGEVESKDSIINVLITENSTQQTTIDSQQTTINDLNNRLTQLENCLSGILPYLCQLSHSAIQANTPAAQEEVRKNLNVTLSNRNAIVLDQNVPNPFAEQTVINFSIPETVQKAQIHFYDGNGRFMNSVELTERGLGSVTVFGSDLSTGVYTYTLVADGQVVATKKMMKQ
jgi:hypothetical protein